MAGQGSTNEPLHKGIDAGRARSDDETVGMPPPAAAVSAVQREEAGSARAQTREQHADAGGHILPGVVAVAVAALSGIAVWMSS
jgi:hypothetical protein